MANITVLRGACSAPFLQKSKFSGDLGCKYPDIDAYTID